MKIKKGFTLMELLLVMVIVAVIFLVGAFTVLNYYQKVKKDTFLTESMTIYKESKKMFSSEYMKGNILSVISTDEGEKALDLTDVSLKYCVNLTSDGDVEKYKITNGIYYIEGTNKEDITVSNTKYGNFVNKFNCDYILDSTDLLEEKVLQISIESKVVKVIEILCSIFIILIVLYFVFRSKNER
ncbi:MAG: type II secretion system protein [Bacilli bacterium]